MARYMKALAGEGGKFYGIRLTDRNGRETVFGPYDSAGVAKGVLTQKLDSYWGGYVTGVLLESEPIMWNVVAGTLKERKQGT